MSIFDNPPPKAKTMPLVECNTCRIFVDPANTQKWYDPASGKWNYRIRCHGKEFGEERIKAPHADAGVIRVGTWSPTFFCKKCGREGIKWEKLKRGYPVSWQTTFQIHHCGTLYCEAFVTESLEKESELRAKGQATPTLDRVELTNYQKIAPFDVPTPEGMKPALPKLGSHALPPGIVPGSAADPNVPRPSQPAPPPMLKPGKRRVRFAKGDDE